MNGLRLVKVEILNFYSVTNQRLILIKAQNWFWKNLEPKRLPRSFYIVFETVKTIKINHLLLSIFYFFEHIKFIFSILA